MYVSHSGFGWLCVCLAVSDLFSHLVAPPVCVSSVCAGRQVDAPPYVRIQLVFVAAESTSPPSAVSSRNLAHANSECNSEFEETLIHNGLTRRLVWQCPDCDAEHDASSRACRGSHGHDDSATDESRDETDADDRGNLRDP
jgi:hypothetical protein